MRRRTFISALLWTPLASSQTARQAAKPAALAIVRPIVSQSEDGSPLEGGEAFLSGEEAFFSFQVSNYKVGENDKVQLSAHIQAFDSKGAPIAPVDEEVIGTTLREEDKSWEPKIRAQIPIPPIALPGAYKIHYEVTDLQTKQSASGDAAFPVRGRAVEPSSTLVIRNFGFYRAETDPAPLKLAAYRAGDILWVRFDVTGYKYGEQNSIDVTYDVAVLTHDGKQLFAQEDAAAEKSQAFYPQPWVPAEFNLSLQSTMDLGAYTLVITAKDAVGNQTSTLKAEFQVE